MTNYDNLLSLIPDGEENAVSMSYMAAALGTTPRIVRAHIHRARIDGEHIIAGTDKGYYIPVTEDELRRYVALAAARGRATFAGITAARRRLRELAAEKAQHEDGQQSIVFDPGKGE